MKDVSIPPGVEVVVGYNNGSLRTYRRGDSVILGDGMRVLEIRTLPGQSPTGGPNSRFFSLKVAGSMLFTGWLGALLYGQWGPWGLFFGSIFIAFIVGLLEAR